MEFLRDRIDREERERNQAIFNAANAPAQVIGLVGSIVGLAGAINENKRAEREIVELKQKVIKERIKSDEAIMQKAISFRKFHADIVGKIIYKLTTYRAEALREEQQTINIEHFKKTISLLLQDYLKDFEQEDIDYAVFWAEKTDLIPYILSYNICPDLAAFINNTAMLGVKNFGINYFYENYKFFFAMFSPQEIENGFPSDQTFTWASEEQVERILISSIPHFGERIVLFKQKLQVFDEFQVNALTPVQIKAIRKAKISFPKSSIIYEKIPDNGLWLKNQSQCCLLI